MSYENQSSRAIFQFITEAFKSEMSIDTKSNTADLVTATDKKVEEFAFSFIKEKYPSHKFIGEESTSETGEQHTLTDNPTWIIDPVDGTTNFVHRYRNVRCLYGLEIRFIRAIMFDVWVQILTASTRGLKLCC